jgi:HAD superfamily hydrolase (TIGR01459 family)
MKALDGLRELAPNYDAILSDVWGVVHNGVKAHPAAVEALVQYRKQGGHVVLITNAPRPAAPIIEMLDGMGIVREAYDALVSSGGATRAILAAEYRGHTLHYVGPPLENDALFEGLNITLGPAEAASAIVVTDLDDDDETPDMYEDRIKFWLERKLPMLCANPDRVVEDGDRIIYCGGALADLYEAHGGMVRMIGKPFRPIYTEALHQAELATGRPLDRAKILAIGDSVRTDAIGAAGAGLDLLFITGSIHAAELDAFGQPDPASIEALLKPADAKVAGFMAKLSW